MRLTVAQALCKFIDNQFVEFDGETSRFIHGIYTIFGHGNVAGLGEALADTSLSYPVYRGNNEQGMAHAAIAYGKQLNRRAAMACTTSIGPGALNCTTAAALATTNRLPLLLLLGDIFIDRQPDPVLQQIEQPHDYSISVNDAFKPLSKYWDRVTHPNQLMTAAVNAFRVLTSPKDTGAVVLCLPQDIQTQAFDFPDEFFKQRIWKIQRPVPYPSDIDNLSAAIKAAKKPLIIAGGGVHYSEACSMLTQFVNTHKIACAQTQAGNGALLANCEWHLGGVGTTGTLAANTMAKEADLIIALGSRLQDFTTASKSQFSAPIFHVNINPFDAVKMNATAIEGDIKMVLDAVSKQLNSYKTSETYGAEVSSLKALWHCELATVLEVTERKSPFSQVEVIGLLNNHLQSEDTIIAAAGSLPGDLHRLWQPKGHKDYHLEYGFSCMGYEVAAGLGVSLAKKQQNCSGESYVLVGDGSYLMMHSELMTAVVEKIKMTVILFDNSGHRCIEALQKNIGVQSFKTALSEENDIDVDFAQYAAALGATVFQPETEDELHHALVQAKKETSPVVIHLKIKPNSMSQGYESWWRVDIADVSAQDAVNPKNKLMQEQLRQSRQY